VLKVSYNYQIFSEQEYGGISRYICEVAARISALKDYDVKINAGLYINEYLDKLDVNLVKGWKNSFVRRIPPALLKKINRKLSRDWIKDLCPDVIHETYYSDETILPKNSRIVITVHDMIYEKFPYLMPSRDSEFHLIKAKAINRADHIICVSNSTKRDLIDILNVDPTKVSTIYHGVNLDKDHNDNKSRIVSSPYILYVGARQVYKNFNRLLQAYTNNKAIRDNFKLVCFGSTPFSKQELVAIRDLGFKKESIFYISGKDHILNNLYKHASAFVYPSLYEGFGLPLLEAMACNCPVVCSDTSSISEIVANAGEFFNPYEVDSIDDALIKVLFSSERSKELTDNGNLRVLDFSWDTCAKQTSSIYKLLA
jgi:glycosyltransferase involved in cell wall biosynthesis